MQEQKKRADKALLVVSFGTTFEETRKVTIDAIERDLADAFPDRRLYRGWTSRMIIRRLRERGICFDTLEEAVERMRADGIRDVLVQPTHIISGAEHDGMLQVLREHADAFRRIAVGKALLDTEKDRRELVQILTETILPNEPEDSSWLVLMGHGSSKKQSVNRIYTQMEQAFRENGYGNVLVATVEGEPQIEEVLSRMGAPRRSGQEVHLAPLMIVAGDHAKNDMAGEEPDSWKNLIRERGYTASLHMQGLGEYPKVREMIAKHAAEAQILKR